jgi:hypothetical protein
VVLLLIVALVVGVVPVPIVVVVLIGGVELLPLRVVVMKWVVSPHSKQSLGDVLLSL